MTVKILRDEEKGQYRITRKTIVARSLLQVRQKEISHHFMNTGFFVNLFIFERDEIFEQIHKMK